MFIYSDDDSDPDRCIFVKGSNDFAAMAYSSDKVTDSEALHHVLCRIDPGDEYTVTFKEVKK